MLWQQLGNEMHMLCIFQDVHVIFNAPIVLLFEGNIIGLYISRVHDG